MISNFLKSGQVGNIATSAQAQARKMIQERWENLGFTQGLKGYLKENMATIFENEATNILSEATDASNSGSFETVVFPLVRRVFSRLLANDIVSVQAMNMATGRLYFIKPVTSEREFNYDDVNDAILQGKTDITGEHKGLMGYKRVNRNQMAPATSADTLENENRYYLPDDVVNGNPEVTKYMKKSLYDLFYNDFLYDNSKGKVHIKVGNVALAELGKDGDWKKTPAVVTSGIDDTVRSVVIAVDGFSNYNPGRLTGPDGNEMDTEAFLASLHILAKSDIKSAEVDGHATAAIKAGNEIHFRVVTQRYGAGIVDYSEVADAKGKIYLELDLTKPVKKPGDTIDGLVGVNPAAISADTVKNSFVAAWAEYDSLELETEMGEVSFQLTYVTVSVEERKLRATWSPEMAQDVSAFHNIDAEAELTAILSEQIAAEVDREILRDLRKGAPWQLKWDYNGWRRMGGFSTNYTQKDWNQMIMTKINQLSAQIHKTTLRGGANFIVVSAELNAVLNDLEYFHVTDANAEANTYSMGIERTGSLQGRYQVYVDPYSPAYSAIIGHKGDSLLDTGYIYAPYVPLQLTPVIYNPENFAPVRGIITRYAKKLVNNRYYAALVAIGLQTWNPAELR